MISVEIKHSSGLADWLIGQDVSLALSCYQTGQLLLVGVRSDGSVSFSGAQFGHVMGLHYHGSGFYASTYNQILRFEEILAAGFVADTDHDALFVPRRAYANAAKLGMGA